MNPQSSIYIQVLDKTFSKLSLEEYAELLKETFGRDQILILFNGDVKI